MDWSKPQATGIHYPESDGKPMAESDLHRDLMLDLITALQMHFEDDPNVYVSGNLFVYFEEGVPSSVVAPDVFMVRGVPNHKRRTFKLWEENCAPCVAIELSSVSTHTEDLEDKRPIYEQLGVEEYYIFDPEGFGDGPPLKAFRLVGAELQSVPVEQKNGAVAVFSPVLGLELRVDGDVVRLFDPQTQQTLPFVSELKGAVVKERRRAREERLRAEEEKARAEEERARAEEEKARAEEEKARAEEEKARAEEEKRRGEERAEEAHKRAEEEQSRADEERRRREELEAELARLRRRLETHEE